MEWIRCGEKWPEPETMVLVYMPQAAEWQRIRTTIRLRPERGDSLLKARWGGAAIGVTHWMPLPDLPKE